MAADAWLPIGFALPGGQRLKSVIDSGLDWQIVGTDVGELALVTKAPLFDWWVDTKVLNNDCAQQFNFGAQRFAAITSGSAHELANLGSCRSPTAKAQATAFALAMRETRALDPNVSLHAGIYVEKLSRLLPTHKGETKVPDDIVLGTWLAGGLNISVFPLRRFQKVLSWLGPEDLKDVVQTAGFEVNEFVSAGAPHVRPQRDRSQHSTEPSKAKRSSPSKQFVLPGRKMLENFFNEHVIEIIQNRDHYKKLGIDFPPAIILEGPPGCGKTFAVEQLVEFLGWPLYAVDAASIASPYIHETSKKVAEVFEQAIVHAPSVVVIDEMEAFLAGRELGSSSSHHRVEEMAEFLRRIPEAVKKGVLIIGMTNRLDMIDQAILRRGRFDQIIKVDYAGEEEVATLLSSLLLDLPKHDDVDIPSLAQKLAGRPLSDVAFVIREGARLAGRARKSSIDNESLLTALASTPSRDHEVTPRRIGFT